LAKLVTLLVQRGKEHIELKLRGALRQSDLYHSRRSSSVLVGKNELLKPVSFLDHKLFECMLVRARIFITRFKHVEPAGLEVSASVRAIESEIKVKLYFNVRDPLSFHPKGHNLLCARNHSQVHLIVLDFKLALFAQSGIVNILILRKRLPFKEGLHCFLQCKAFLIKFIIIIIFRRLPEGNPHHLIA
jgi:hypothetical protein